MALDIMRITAALNAYPWTRGVLTYRNEVAANYCAVGLLLRYAGVPQSEIECANDATTAVWTRYRELLEAEYGITTVATIHGIICANDSAATHEEAIAQVQFVLDGGNLGEPRTRRAAAAEALAEAQRDLEDDASGCGALLV